MALIHKRGSLKELTNLNAGRRLGEKDRADVAQEHKLSGLAAAKPGCSSNVLQPTGGIQSRAYVRPAVPVAASFALADPQDIVDYSAAVLECRLRVDKETRLKPNPNYIQDVQAPEVTDKMRGILVDWIAEVHHKFKLDPETLFLAVNLFDRFLSKRKVERKKLQLVGVTCFLVASKYEDTFPPEIRDCVSMTDSAYTAQSLLDTEITVLNTLGFQISVASPYFFLQQMLRADDVEATEELKAMSQLVLELQLLESRMLPHPARLMAAGAFYISKVIVLGVRDPWNSALERVAGATGSEARAVARQAGDTLQKCMHPQAQLTAIRKKFHGGKRKCTSVEVACRWLASRGVAQEELFCPPSASAGGPAP